MLDMLKHFRVLAQVFFSFSFVKSVSHSILYLHLERFTGKAIKALSNADLVYISKKFFSCITYVCSPNTSTTRRIFMLVWLHLS